MHRISVYTSLVYSYGSGYIIFTYADTMPLLRHLHLLKSSSGEVVKVKESVCAHWKDVAIHLSFSSGLIHIIEKKGGPEEAFDDMMTRWLNGAEGTRKPITWRTLLTVLQDIDYGVLANDLQSVLSQALSS